MTLWEFKAWLDGFETAMAGKPPTIEQWKTIKAKIAKIQVSAAADRGGFSLATQMADTDYIR